MGQLAYSVAGAAVGYYMGGVEGARYGWAVGTVVGGIVSPPKGPDGPRLGDLSVQTSAYGQPIPRLWGTQRIAGQVIWATQLIERENEQGGKGGSSYSTYSYSCSFAVGLCRGPIDGIARIWADGKLIYNIRPENLGNQVGYTATSMVVYQGTEDQEVDPTIQALMTDAPAYRGLAYVVFTGLELERFGNRIPNLTFEVVSDGVEDLPAATTFGEEYVLGGTTFKYDMASDGKLWVSTTDGHAVDDTDAPYGVAIDMDGGGGFSQVQRYDPVSGVLLEYFTVPTTDWTGYSTISGAGVCYGDRYYIGRGGPGVARAAGIACGQDETGACGNPQPYTHGWSFGPAGSAIEFIDGQSSGQFQNALYWPSVPFVQDYEQKVIYFIGGGGVAGGFGVGFRFDGRQAYALGDDQDIPARCACNPNVPPGSFTGVSVRAPHWAFNAIPIDNGAILQGYEPGGSSYLSHAYIGESAGSIPGSNVVMPPALNDPARGALWIFGGADFNQLYNFSSYQDFAFPAVPGESQGNHVRAMTVDAATGNLRILIGGGIASAPRLLLFNPDTHVTSQEIDLGDLDIASAPGKMWDIPAQRRVIFANGYKIHSIPYGETLDPRPVLLSTIVRELSIEAGLTEDDIDVTALTDLVYGFVVSRQGSARTAIENLMNAFAFDSVESEGKVRFVKRGSRPVIEIPDDDLSAHADGGNPPPKLSLTRGDESDLPRVVGVSYINPENDYQPGHQSARRLTGMATGEVSIEIPVVMYDAAAKAVADSALYSAWAGRTAARWQTTWKYSHVEPSDVVEISGNPILVKKVSREANVLHFEGAFDSGQTITSGALAGSVYPTVVAPEPVTLPALSQLLMLDIPIVNDAHDGPGHYAAVTPYGTPWTGAAIMKSTDDGGTFATATSTTAPAVTGAATTALGDFTPNLFDEFNTVSVTLLAGTLSSATELSVLNGANVALVGRELLQFKRAVLQDDGSYILSGLLRGRAGTPTGEHIAGEQFVLMTSAVLRIDGVAAEIGLLRQYKAVTFGSSIEGAAAVFFSNAARGLLPLSGVLLGSGRDAAGNITINWVRRTRVDAQWRDNVDAGLGEASESYEIDVYDGASYLSVLRTISTTATTATYTAAQQVTDFGSEQAEVHVRIYQLSAVVGRGSVLEGAV
jgi:hypothetical protein